MGNNEILAHRGNFLPEGPIPTIERYDVPENTLEAFDRAFKKNWGIETDVRQAKEGAFFISHDEQSTRVAQKSSQYVVPSLEDFFKLVQKYKKPFIAFQIKRSDDPESGIAVGRAVALGLQEYGIQNSILFDATIEEAEILHKEFPWLNLSVSCGEKNYSPTIYTPDQVLSDKFRSTFTSVWADEWKENGNIYNRDMFNNLKNAYPKGRIDVISPELHYSEDHPLSKNIDEIKKLWEEILKWGTVGGICTDYPSKLEEILLKFII